MRNTVRLCVTLSFAIGMALPLAGVASAACHAFSVEADPSSASEGQTVTLTISRDADVQPSSVRVRTVEGSASGGDDYTPLDERVEFTSGTEQTRQITIVDDEGAEGAETFDIQLSDAQGCEINQNFSYGSATVTISANDAAAEQSAEPESTPSESRAAQTPTVQATSESSTTADEDLPDTGAPVILTAMALLGLASGGALVRRSRRR